jgi:hypothetical protein
MLRAGTRIELHEFPALPGFPAVAPEKAVIGHWRESVSGPRDKMIGWHIVAFANGAKLCVHESRFRVIDKHSGMCADMPPKVESHDDW